MNENKETGYLQSPFDKETKRFCMTLKLKDNPKLIEEYEKWHKSENIWEEIPEGIRKVGILDMEIYRTGIILFMILTVPSDFDFGEQMGKLRHLHRQLEWEKFMENYQNSEPGSSSAEKWKKAERIFKLP